MDMSYLERTNIQTSLCVSRNDDLGKGNYTSMKRFTLDRSHIAIKFWMSFSSKLQLSISWEHKFHHSKTFIRLRWRLPFQWTINFFGWGKTRLLWWRIQTYPILLIFHLILVLRHFFRPQLKFWCAVNEKQLMGI